MLRLVFIVALVILFVVPIYHLLKRRTTRIKSELEDETPDVQDRLEELKQKQHKLQVDVSENLRTMKQKTKVANSVQIQIGRIVKK